jgi:hypothetical protein
MVLPANTLCVPSRQPCHLHEHLRYLWKAPWRGAYATRDTSLVMLCSASASLHTQELEYCVLLHQV